MKPIIWLVLLLLGFASQRCANPGMPQGGPKDTTPPKLLNASPPNYSTYFSADRFFLTFDEYLSLRDINKQFLVSPPMAKTPVFKLRKRTLEVRFQDSLRANTTYSLYFGDAITDLNENNPVGNFQYVFSTGSALDSLELSGQVVNAFNLKPVENAFAMLYDAGNDTLSIDEMPLHFPPVYIAKTDKNGSFFLRNLRNENFLLIALKDANGNYFFDQPNEEIAFYDAPALAYYQGLKTDSLSGSGPVDSLVADTVAPKSWQLISKKAEYKLLSFLEADTVQRLLKKELLSSYQLSLQFKLPVSGFRLRLILPSDTLYMPLPDFNTTKDSLNFWFPDYLSDSVHLVVSADGITDDTLAMPILKATVASRRPADKPETLVMRLPAGQRDAFKPLTLAFNRPVKSVNADSLLLIENTDTMAVSFRFTDSLQKRIAIEHTLQFGASYVLVVNRGTFMDILGFSNDSTPSRFNTRQADAYGTLKMSVRPPEDGPYLIQMMDEKENLIRQDRVTGHTTIDYGRLLPRKVLFKAIRDENDNGKWDSGNYRRRQQPEKVQYFGSTVEIRANWDLTEEWSLE
jgi:hypothetical protein